MMPNCSGVVLVHDTRFNDSRSNDARLMHKLCKDTYYTLYRDHSWYQGKKKFNRDIQRPGFLGAEHF